MSALPEVLEVYLTTGEYDYLIKVAVNGTAGYEEFLRRKLYKVRGIRHSRSSFAIRCLKRVQSFVPPAP
jgi:Lrp/AsnC family leucine-responsive transcriptional regulator